MHSLSVTCSISGSSPIRLASLLVVLRQAAAHATSHFAGMGCNELGGSRPLLREQCLLPGIAHIRLFLRVYSFFYAAEGKAALVTLSQCLTLSPRRLDAAVSEFKAESRARSECRSPSGDATGPQEPRPRQERPERPRGEGERRTNAKAFRGLLGAIRLLYGSSWGSRFDPGLKLRKRSPEEQLFIKRKSQFQAILLLP